MTPDDAYKAAQSAIRTLEDRQRLRRAEWQRVQAETLDRLMMQSDQNPWADYDRAFLTDLGISPLE